MIRTFKTQAGTKALKIPAIKDGVHYVEEAVYLGRYRDAEGEEYSLWTRPSELTTDEPVAVAAPKGVQ